MAVRSLGAQSPRCRRGRRLRLAVAAGADAGGAGDAVRIEDHDHRAVAQDGVAAEHRDVAQDRRHRLDHDLLGVEHAVDDDAKHVGADLGDHDVGAGIGPLPALASASRSVRLTSGSSRSRRRSTGVSLMRSIIDLGPPSPRSGGDCARTSSTTLICGMAKRSPPASTISAETIASVSGILMVKVVPWPGDALQVDRCRRSSRCWSSPRPCRRRGRTPR